MPFGMVQVSPDNGGQGGYDYKRDYIHGFSQTHLSGVGCGVVGELPMMPTTGEVGSTDQDGYRSTFSHANEQAEPGYYRVHLDRYDTDVELTATTRTGWQRYAFPATDKANVLFDAARANMGVQGSQSRSRATTRSRAGSPRVASAPAAIVTAPTSRRSSTGRSRPTARGRTTRSHPARAARRTGRARTARGSRSTPARTRRCSSRSACPTPASRARGRTSPPRPRTGLRRDADRRARSLGADAPQGRDQRR